MNALDPAAPTLTVWLKHGQRLGLGDKVGVIITAVNFVGVGLATPLSVFRTALVLTQPSAPQLQAVAIAAGVVTLNVVPPQVRARWWVVGRYVVCHTVVQCTVCVMCVGGGGISATCELTVPCTHATHHAAVTHINAQDAGGAASLTYSVFMRVVHDDGPAAFVLVTQSTATDVVVPNLLASSTYDVFVQVSGGGVPPPCSRTSYI